MITWLDDTLNFPRHHQASPDGLLAAGGDLSPERILSAYRLGIFPWFSDGQPPLWWSPDPRMVLFPTQFSAHRSLRKAVLNTRFTVRFNSDFRQVISQCANTPRRGQPGTWLTAEMQSAYCQLHNQGHAHSVETWDGDTLVGGLYGIAIGKVFYGESMFSHRTNASKIAFCHLVQQLNEQGYFLLDCQVYSDHLASLGAVEIPRDDFLALLQQLTPAIHTFSPPENSKTMSKSIA